MNNATPEDGNSLFEEARLAYFFNHSQNRRLRRKMAKELRDDDGVRLWRRGWQAIKSDFPPYNTPNDMGIRAFKKAGHSNEEVVEYKKKARATFINT